MKAVILSHERGGSYVLDHDGCFRYIRGHESTPIGAEIQIGSRPVISVSRIAAIAASFIIVLSLSIFTWMWNTADHYVYVDINPSIELQFNRFGRLKEAVPLDDDAVELLKNLNLSGSLEDVLAAIIAKAEEQGYLSVSNGQPSVLVTVIARGAVPADQIVATINTALQERESPVLAVVEIGSMDLFRRAEVLRVSPGRLKLAEVLFGGYDSSLTLEELLEMRVDQLYLYIEDAQTPLSPFIDDGPEDNPQNGEQPPDIIHHGGNDGANAQIDNDPDDPDPNRPDSTSGDAAPGSEPADTPQPSAGPPRRPSPTPPDSDTKDNDPSDTDAQGDEPQTTAPPDAGLPDPQPPRPDPPKIDPTPPSPQPPSPPPQPPRVDPDPPRPPPPPPPPVDPDDPDDPDPDDPGAPVYNATVTTLMGGSGNARTITITVEDEFGIYTQTFDYQNGTDSAIYTISGTDGDYKIKIIFEGNAVASAEIIDYGVPAFNATVAAIVEGQGNERTITIEVTDDLGTNTQTLAYQNGAETAIYTISDGSGHYTVKVVYQGNNVKAAEITDYDDAPNYSATVAAILSKTGSQRYITIMVTDDLGTTYTQTSAFIDDTEFDTYAINGDTGDYTVEVAYQENTVASAVISNYDGI